VNAEVVFDRAGFTDRVHVCVAELQSHAANAALSVGKSLASDARTEVVACLAQMQSKPIFEFWVRLESQA
jgi:hypothetical protein